MKRFLFSVFLHFISAGVSFAQNGLDSTLVANGDSLVQINTTRTQDSLSLSNSRDSVSRENPAGWETKMPVIDTGWRMDPLAPGYQQKFSWQLLKRNPYFGFSATPEWILSDSRQVIGKEWMFYLLIYLLLIYAFLRGAFPKYFHDLFGLFFRNTLKQRQIREQLMERSLPSLLLNVFFVFTGGLYITFLLQHFKLKPEDNFWLLFFYSMVALSGIYLIKFIGLKFSGWLFNARDLANSYIFIVFIVNKMIGILLIPFLIILAFTSGDIYSVGLTLSVCMVAVLFLYRVVLTFGVVRNQVKVNLFHFFLYICGFEVAPLLLIYKGLLLFFHITA